MRKDFSFVLDCDIELSQSSTLITETIMKHPHTFTGTETNWIIIEMATLIVGAFCIGFILGCAVP